MDWPCRTSEEHTLDLTGSLDVAERCFAQAIDDAQNSAPCGEAYRLAMARRCVIKAVIETFRAQRNEILDTPSAIERTNALFY